MQKNELTVVDYFRTTNLAFSFYPEADVEQKRRSAVAYALDKTDYRILKRLAQDARMPSLQIAQEIGVSVDTVIDRIKKMYDAKIIYKFTVRTNRDNVHHNRYVYAVRFRHFAKKHRGQLAEFVKNHPQITRCVKVHGSYDVLFYISASTTELFHQTITQIKKLFAEIIFDYETWVTYNDDSYNNLPPAVLTQSGL